MLKFKNKEDQMLFSLLNPILIMIYADLYTYAKENYQIELTITDTVSTPEKDKKLGRVSSSHQEGRALDVRTRDIDVFIVNDLVNYINYKWAYQKYRYMSKEGNMRLAYLHIGTASHIHLAIHSKYKVNNIQKQVADLVRSELRADLLHWKF